VHRRERSKSQAICRNRPLFLRMHAAFHGGRMGRRQQGIGQCMDASDDPQPDSPEGADARSSPNPGDVAASGNHPMGKCDEPFEQPPEPAGGELLGVTGLVVGEPGADSTAEGAEEAIGGSQAGATAG
jgi:hypothetical protein